MTRKNKYVNRSKISEATFRQFVKLFSLDLDAGQIDALIGLPRNTGNRYLTGLRVRITEFCEEASPISGRVEVEESCPGGKHSGKRGRGTEEKVIVFWLFRRNRKVYTEIVPDVNAKTLQSIIRGRVSIDSVIHSDKWRAMTDSLTLVMKSILRLITAGMNISQAHLTSMALKGFGDSQKRGYSNLEAYPNPISICT